MEEETVAVFCTFEAIALRMMFSAVRVGAALTSTAKSPLLMISGVLLEVSMVSV